jgi:cytoskeletal protein RodZ
MDTNTIMLIALAILIVLSALGIWLANRGSGVEDPHRAVDPVTDDEGVTSADHTTTTSTTKTATTATATADHAKTPITKPVDTKKPTSNVKVVDNTKKAPSTSKAIPNTKNPPKS